MLKKNLKKNHIFQKELKFGVTHFSATFFLHEKKIILVEKPKQNPHL